MNRVWDLGGRLLLGRVQGLAVTRSLGDLRGAPYIIPDAEIQSRKLTPEDQFLILASDGVWDVLSNEEACELVNTTLEMPSGDNAPSDAALVVVRKAIKKGTRDNVSAIVVDLQKKRIQKEMKQVIQHTQEQQEKSLWESLSSFFWSK